MAVNPFPKPIENDALNSDLPHRFGLTFQLYIQDASPQRGSISSPHHEGAGPPILPGGVGGSCEGSRKIGSGPTGLKVGPRKGPRTPLTMDGCVSEG